MLLNAGDLQIRVHGDIGLDQIAFLTQEVDRRTKVPQRLCLGIADRFLLGCAHLCLLNPSLWFIRLPVR